MLSKKNITNHLLSLASEKTNTLSDFGTRTNQTELAHILRHLLHKRFRRWPLSADYKTKIINTIRYCLDSNKPIVFTYPIGGYKLWRLSVAPECDWAEYFALARLIRHLGVLETYFKRGMILEFVTDNYFTEKVTNLPSKSLVAYRQSFLSLIKYFNNMSLYRLNLKYTDIEEITDIEKMKKYVITIIKNRKIQWKHIPPELRQKKLQMAKLNMVNTNSTRPIPTQDLINSILLHEAYLTYPNRINYLQRKESIMLFNDPVPRCIAIGSVKASRVKFWTGVGLLETRKDDKLIERILSPQQLSTIRSENREVDVPDLGLIGMNFNKIRLVSFKGKSITEMQYY